jgi:hypothetical protein
MNELARMAAPMRLPAPPSCPLLREDESWAVEHYAAAVGLVLEQLRERGSERLEATLKKLLREGELQVAIGVVELAGKGDFIADRALRSVGAEFLDAMIQKRDLPLGGVQIVSYLQRAAGRAPLQRKPGRHECDLWYRNICICVLVKYACAWLGVRPTRSLASKRPGRRPSGCSIVAAALARVGIPISEEAVQQHIWLGPWGEVARGPSAESLYHIFPGRT